MNNSSNSRCAACKYLRRRCPSDCIFSPYFPSNNQRRFVNVHKIYGASNVGKLLKELPVHVRAEAADSLHYEASCRIKDPVYGCAGVITILQQRIQNAEGEIARVQAQISAHQLKTSRDGIVSIAANDFVPEQNGVLTSNDLFDDISNCWFP